MAGVVAMFGRHSAPKTNNLANFRKIFVLLVNYKYAKAAVLKIGLFDWEIYFRFLFLKCGRLGPPTKRTLTCATL